MSWSLKDFDRLDPKLFKAFMAASDAGSFTIAADVACMTQGGISQHISKLEEQIGLPLFNRVGRQVTLTDTGRQLVDYVKRYLEMMNDFRETVVEKDDSLSGMVTYAMPASCLLSPHFSMLLQRRLEYDAIELDVRLEPTNKVVELVLADKADFGFVTRNIEHPELDLVEFCTEEYVLVGAPRFIQYVKDATQISKLKFVRYPGFETYCEMWMQAALGSKWKYSPFNMEFCGHGSTIETAILMVRGQLGISIFPRHCIKDFLKSGELIEYPLAEPVLNEIRIAKARNYYHPKRVLKVIDWFLEMRTCSA